MAILAEALLFAGKLVTEEMRFCEFLITQKINHSNSGVCLTFAASEYIKK
jgi:hypothetical protein